MGLGIKLLSFGKAERLLASREELDMALYA
jgi:hypothetical protein